MRPPRSRTKVDTGSVASAVSSRAKAKSISMSDLRGKVSSAVSGEVKTTSDLAPTSQPVAPPEKGSFFGKLKSVLTAKPTARPSTEYEDIMADVRGKKRKY